jgi:hypothetical protein
MHKIFNLYVPVSGLTRLTTFLYATLSHIGLARLFIHGIATRRLGARLEHMHDYSRTVPQY